MVKDCMFSVDPAFESGSAELGHLTLSQVRLQLDRRWPWLILIPRQAGMREIEDLSPTDQAQLMTEIVACGPVVRAMGEAMGLAVEKLNIGALGNVTSQLHVHIVGRRDGDPAWPGPVWGVGVADPLLEPERSEISNLIRTAMLI